MITIEGLKALGADTDSGLVRCLNNEAFYLKLVKMALEDGNYEKLKEAVSVPEKPFLLSASNFTLREAVSCVKVQLFSPSALSSFVPEKLKVRPEIRSWRSLPDGTA